MQRTWIRGVDVDTRQLERISPDRKKRTTTVASQNQHSSRASRPRVLHARPPLRREADTVDLTIRLVSEHSLTRVHRKIFKEMHWATLRDLGVIRRRRDDIDSTTESIQHYHRARTGHNP
ncbi:hypothetical protein DPMN_150988 [Dreissena polymorpha]|uniref:Uncharacterized protein n=1 Tax=Dreissena polymorpha TaxID=45954 RepID=A0A9D4J6V2_DREPO|nr:hypothetical protein DPMN_150988 [Dreissena polymorpha]